MGIYLLSSVLIAIGCAAQSSVQLASSRDATSYVMTPEEIDAFIAVKRSVYPTYQPFISRPIISNRTFEQSEPKWPRPPKYKHHKPGDRYPAEETTEADCLSHNRLMINSLRHYFQWMSASCDLPGESGDYTVKCSSVYTVRPTHAHVWKGQDMKFTHFCKAPQVCMDINIGPTPRHLSIYHDIICVDPKQVQVKEHAAIAHHSQTTAANGEPDWCSLPQIIPEFEYPSTYQMTTFLLTEEVSWANGSDYLAPKLSIRDSPSYYHIGYDRAYRTNTNALSTTLNVGSSRGKLQPRKVEFCMDMLTGGEVWTVMMFTWIKIVSRHGRIPSQTDYEVE